MVAAEGQTAHELEIDDELYADHGRMLRLHETHHVADGVLTERPGRASR